MAISAYAIDNSEWTFSDDLVTQRTDLGTFITQRVENPWAFIRFADPSEGRNYVCPINGTAWLPPTGLPPGRYVMNEVMPFLPFPLETARQPRTSGGASVGDNAGGPIAVHFFGWV